MLDVVIVGSGPYGISVAAHVVHEKLKYKLFGYPMDFWRNQMPQDMFIRTPHDFVSFSDPLEQWTIHNYSLETGRKIETPLPRPVFVDYANWFAEKAEIEFTPTLVKNIGRKDEYYLITTEDDEVFEARNVVVATGVEHFKYVPPFLNDIPSESFSHTSGYTNFSLFKGRKVAVLGSGQSAWEAAGLLYREEADVELIYRRDAPNYAGSRENEILLRDLGNVFYNLSLAEKKEMWVQSPGSVAHFLKPYVDGIVPQFGNMAVKEVEQFGVKQLKIIFSNGEEKVVDHIIAATGFRIDMDRLPFMSKEELLKVDREEGYTQFPRVDEYFESSLSGLYFAGPLSSQSHGPTFRFILGLKKTASSIVKSLTKELVRE